MSTDNAGPCDASEGGPCTANDGDPCAACEAWWETELAYWGARYRAAPRHEKLTKEEYDTELRDAGRGHLVAP